MAPCIVNVRHHGRDFRAAAPPRAARRLAERWRARTSPGGDLLPPERGDAIEVATRAGRLIHMVPTGDSGRPWRSARVGALVPSQRGRIVAQIPNIITAAGYALGIWWVAGGPAWAALVSIVADELDGRVARALGVASEFGSKFDWTTDVVLTAATLQKMRAPVWAILASTIGQVALRDHGFRPTFGSARAVLMLWDVARAFVARGPSVSP